MLSLFKVLLATLAMASLTAAAPHKVETRTTRCNPNLQGAAVKVIDTKTGRGWYTTSSALGASVDTTPNTRTKWRMEFTGQPLNDHIIKLDVVPANNVLLQPTSSNLFLQLGQVKATNSPSWNISCKWCLAPGKNPVGKIATGCTFQSTSNHKYINQKENGNLVLTNKALAYDLRA